MTVEEVIEKIIEICRRFSVREVYLYGSRAKGTNLERSDIDIAVTGAEDFGELLEDILVQYYAITDFVAGSPKEVLRQSFKARLIDEQRWMEMLRVRNELAHDYDETVIREYCSNIIEEYIDLFCAFEKNVIRLLSEDAEQIV